MVKRCGEYQGKNPNSRERTSSQPQQKTAGKSTYKERIHNKGYNRSNSTRHSSSDRFNSNKSSTSTSSSTRYSRRVRAEETVDDIRMDINRIEKEIRLELKEIRSMKL